MRTAAALLLPAILAPALPSGEIREEILVIVNNHIITRRTFQQAVEQEHAALYRQFSGRQLDEKLRDAREKTLQGMIDAYIIEDKAEELGIRIPDDYLRANVEEIKKQYNFATDADFERALRSSQGIGLEEFIRYQKRQILQQEVLRKEVYSKIAIEDQELRAYYEDHKDEYKQPSRFRIRELVIAKGGTPETQQGARETIARIQTALQQDTPFEDLVKAHSTAPSRDMGGDSGWLTQGLLRSDIERAALALKPGQVSDVIETDKDFHLVQLVASEMEVSKPFSDVKAQIIQKLQEPKAQNALQNYLQSQRIRANIRYQVEKDSILKG